MFHVLHRALVPLMIVSAKLSHAQPVCKHMNFHSIVSALSVLLFDRKHVLFVTEQVPQSKVYALCLFDVCCMSADIVLTALHCNSISICAI